MNAGWSNGVKIEKPYKVVHIQKQLLGEPYTRCNDPKKYSEVEGTT